MSTPLPAASPAAPHAAAPTPVTSPAARRRLRVEILIVLAISFGVSGVRSVLRLVNSLLDPRPLNEQSVTLNAPQSSFAWLDVGLQLCSAGVLFAYGALALYLLAGESGGSGARVRMPRFRGSDLAHGAGLAALIGIPGLALYMTALHFGWTKEVIPTAFTNPYVEAPALLLWSAANAFGEEVVVVFWLLTRLRQLRWGVPGVLTASAVLRGSYHLYQGVSAGFGNLAMGVIFGAYYLKTGRVWPLIIAHFLIDAVAFVGYALIGDQLGL